MLPLLEQLVSLPVVSPLVSSQRLSGQVLLFLPGHRPGIELSDVLPRVVQ